MYLHIAHAYPCNLKHCAPRLRTHMHTHTYAHAGVVSYMHLMVVAGAGGQRVAKVGLGDEDGGKIIPTFKTWGHKVRRGIQCPLSLLSCRFCFCCCSP